MLLDPTGGGNELTPDRAWWLRVPAVLLSPRAVFYALREDDPEDVHARSEPILLVIWLAGAASVLTTPAAGRLLDRPGQDWLDVAVWTFIFGGIYGAAAYFFLGFAIFFGSRLIGGLGSFGRDRQLVGFALVPLALSFFVVVPLQLALYGDDVFRTGGADEGTRGAALLALQLAFAAWSLGLLLIGVRVVHGWDWLRAAAVVVSGAALLTATVGVFVLL